MSTNEKKVSNYFTYPREFVTYRWYKPLIVTALGAVFYVILSIVVMGIGYAIGGREAMQQVMSASGYDGADMYTATGVFVNMGGVAILLLALFLASLIVKDRPFSSYSSSRGGFDFKVFFKCLLIALVVCGTGSVLTTVLTDGFHFNNHFTIGGFILLLILVPLQCIAEEYIFRGLATQTLGSWIKIPIIAIIVQTIIFTLGHPYNMIGRIEIFSAGLLMGVMALLTNGLEASSAIHVVNNLVFFLMYGFGMTHLTSEADWASVIATIVIDLIYIGILYYLKKKNTFNHILKDDVTLFNEKALAKQNHTT